MKESSIKLENLIPISSIFKLNQFKDFEFKLKPCTGGILIDMSKSIGVIEELLTVPNAENVSKIAMSLMEYESALKFKKQNVKFVDVMTGDENEVEIGGYKLLMHAIQGITEQYLIYGAILKSMGYGEKRTEEMIKKLTDGMNKMVNETLDDITKKKTRKRAKKKKQ